MEESLLTCAQVINGGDARVRLEQEETSLILFSLHGLGLLILLLSSMEELSSERSFLLEIGYGLLCGFFQNIRLMEIGQPVERSTLWNPEEMKTIRLEMLVLSALLYIGDQAMIKIDGQKPPSSTSIPSPFPKTGILMDLNGQKTVSSPISTTKQTLFWM